MVNYAYLIYEGLGGFYSSIEPTPISWAERSFLIEKILINVRILQDSSHIGSPLTRGYRRAQGISI